MAIRRLSDTMSGAARPIAAPILQGALMASAPVVVMFVPCETVQRDLITNLLTMTGVVGSAPWVVDRQRFPTTLGRLFVYVVLSGVHGDAKFDVRLSPLDDGRGGRQHCAVRAKSPVDCCEAVVNIGYWQIDKPGEYALDLLWYETPLATRRLSVRHVPPTPPARAEGGAGPEPSKQ
jgi:hypothetical protein